jgi:peptidoglycan/LPS O-acetylase OafA/YrhL
VSGGGGARTGRRRRPAPPAVAPPPGNPRFAGIDGLRAVAAIAVLICHCAVYTANPGTDFIGSALLRLGPFGVAVFFAISRFLLYRPFVAAQPEGAPQTASRRNETLGS